MSQTPQHRRMTKKRRPLLWVLFALALILGAALIALAVWGASGGFSEDEAVGESTPFTGARTVQEGEAVGLEYSSEASVSLRRGVVYFWFANPEGSGLSMSARITLDGQTVADVSTLEPGRQISSQYLEKTDLQPGQYEALLTVSYIYAGGAVSSSTTDLPITLTVE